MHRRGRKLAQLDSGLLEGPPDVGFNKAWRRVETAGTEPGLRGSVKAATRIQTGQEQQLQSLVQRGISEEGFNLDQQVGQGV
jgi:hypothetical protein